MLIGYCYPQRPNPIRRGSLEQIMYMYAGIQERTPIEDDMVRLTQ